MQSIRTLLAGIVDYAGLFPPAQLPMTTAVRNYADYRQGPHAWMLGRFIVPAARLGELGEALGPLKNQIPWKLSALCALPLEEDLKRIEEFRARALAAEVDAIEIKVARPEEIELAAQVRRPTLVPYFEFPMQADPSGFTSAISGQGARAKMRTGGVTAESIPDASSIAQFVLSCAAAGIPFKATAGLHHPLRGLHRLWPGPDSERATMHGFLNVFLAAAFARAGLGLEETRELLHEESLQAFAFETEYVRWRGNEVSQAMLLRVRKTFAIAFGSCSFEEPVEDLKSLSLI